MSSIQQYGAGIQGRGSSRRVARTMGHIEGRTAIELAEIEARADVQSAQVEALAAVTQRGLQGVAFISQVEQHLAQTVPLATSRLQAVADIGALGITQVVMDTANKLRRS